MLNQDDRRRLETIERQLRETDPLFADGLREGVPRQPCGDRRYPMVISGALAGLLFLIATMVNALGLMAFAMVTGAVSVYLYRRRVRRSHAWTRHNRWKPRW